MWYKCWNVFLQGGWTVFNQLPLLFAVSGIVIYLHNRFFDTELPEWLGSFSGSTFVFMIGFFVMIPVAVLACAFWPKVQLGITAFQGFVKSAGAIGIFVFNFLERALIPFGLHHLLYSPFYYDNVVVPGGLYAYWAKLLPQIAVSIAQQNQRKRKNHFLRDISGSIVVLIFAGICMFAMLQLK